MVAFVTSLIFSIVMIAAIGWYSNRRPKDTPVSWGEAMLGATYVFFLVFIIFGVVPHQWLTLAENELGWRSDRFFFGWGGFVRPQSQGGWFPFDITYRAISDSIAVGIYVIYGAGTIAAWIFWQKRGENAEAKAKKALEKRTTYGRPLVKQG